jgi:hypothetical protein
MASEVEICNLALSHLGERASITSISPPDQSKYAGDAAMFYSMARDIALEAYAWDFATTRVALAQTTNTFTNWEYAYSLPADYLKAREVFDANAIDESADNPFSVEGQILYTNVENAVLRYTKKITNTGLFSPTFVFATSLLVASYLAGPVTKSRKVSNELLLQYRAVISQASSLNGNASNFMKDHTPEWLRMRQR